MNKTKNEMYAVLKYKDGSTVVCSAKKDNKTWVIGGDYDFRNVILIANVSKGVWYSFKNGRLKFSDFLAVDDISNLRLGKF